MTAETRDNLVQLDALIIGGGGAGLWLLDDLQRNGFRALLIERDKLGHGQTVCAQGIIHGGLKYTLDGLLHKSAAAIADMPELWKDALAGHTRDNSLPDLSQTRVRSEACYIWRTDSLASRLGMVGAKVGLRVKPEKLNVRSRPDILADCPGTVSRLAEQVIDPISLLNNLRDRNRSNILRIGEVGSVVLSHSNTSLDERSTIAIQHQNGASIELTTKFIVLTAGSGNADLARVFGLDSTETQLRPLHMVMLRGNNLPKLNGHCIDGRKTRATITSDIDSNGRTVWQVGGQLAEDGVEMSREALLTHAASELRDVLPSFDFSDLEWATYRIDRAEPQTISGTRPDDAVVISRGNIIIGWPTKLALVPRLSAKVIQMMRDSDIGDRGRNSVAGTSPVEEPDRSHRPEACATDSVASFFTPYNFTPPAVAAPPWEWNNIKWTRNY